MNSKYQAELRKLQKKLQQEKKNITIELINYYFAKYHVTNECSYIRAKKAGLVWVDLLNWFGKNYFQQIERFNFKEAIKRANKDLEKLRTNLYMQWERGEFKEEIKALDIKRAKLEKKGKELSYIQELKYEFLVEYQNYRQENKIYIKRDLGIKEW
ncbi:MAG: hypothetical protein ACTSPD_09950 [Promethearchaeota archaeon]